MPVDWNLTLKSTPERSHQSNRVKKKWESALKGGVAMHHLVSHFTSESLISAIFVGVKETEKSACIKHCVII